MLLPRDDWRRAAAAMRSPGSQQVRPDDVPGLRSSSARRWINCF